MSTPFSVPDSRTNKPDSANGGTKNQTVHYDEQTSSNPAVPSTDSIMNIKNLRDEPKSNETVQWNYDIPLPWTKGQTEAWEALIPRSIPMVLKMTRT